MGLRAFIGVGGWFLQGVCTLLGAANTALAEQEGGGGVGAALGGVWRTFKACLFHVHLWVVLGL